jgi:hypothetical protein
MPVIGSKLSKRMAETTTPSFGLLSPPARTPKHAVFGTHSMTAMIAPHSQEIIRIQARANPKHHQPPIHPATHSSIHSSIHPSIHTPFMYSLMEPDDFSCTWNKRKTPNGTLQKAYESPELLSP